VRTWELSFLAPGYLRQVVLSGRKSPKTAMESDHGEPRVRKTPGLSVCRRSQDLITDEAGQRMWAALFPRLFPQAYQRLTSLQVRLERG